MAFLGSTVGRLGPLLLGRHKAWDGLTLLSSAIATAGMGGGRVGLQTLLMGHPLSLGMSHPIKSLLGFPFPALLAKENRLFMLIY